MKRISKAAANPLILLAILFAASVHAIVGGFSDGKPEVSSRSGGYGNVPFSKRADTGGIAAGDRRFFPAPAGSRHALAAVYGKAGSGSFILDAGGDSPHSIAARAGHANPGYQVLINAADGFVQPGMLVSPLNTGSSNPGTPLTIVGYGLGVGGYGLGGGGLDGYVMVGYGLDGGGDFGFNETGFLLPDEEGIGMSIVYLLDSGGAESEIIQFVSEYYWEPFASPVPELEPAAYWLMGLLLLGGVALLHRERTGSCNQSATKS